MLHSRLRGRDLHAPTNEVIENQSGGSISSLKVVRLDGMGTSYPKVVIADPNIYPNFGVMYDTTANGKSGNVCCFGFMFEVNTAAWAPGTQLYSDASGNLTTTPLGGIVAQVIKQDTEDGILYVTTEAADSVNSISWRLEGNSGTDPNVNFLGTIDNKPLKIRTNSLHRALFDEEGRFGIGPDLTTPQNHYHQKTHTGFDGSGFRQETWSLLTQANTSQAAFSIPITQNSVVKVEFHAIGRLSDQSGFGVFKRTATFYRANSNVQTPRVWQSDYTEKTETGFDVSYSMSVSEVTIYVKSPVNLDTYWTGHVEIEAVETNE